jgi:hypothetical protein
VLLEAAHAQGGGITDANIDVVGEAARTALNFYLATQGVDSRPEPLAVAKVMEAVGGEDLAQTAGSRHARDIQFEIMLWGLLRAGGAKVWFDEPDLRFLLGDEHVGVAAKRIWSQDHARRRLSKGARQILATRLRGLIATNVQEYLDPATALGDLVEKGVAFNEDVGRLHGQIPYVAGKAQVLGLVLSGSALSGGRRPTVGPRIVDLSTFTQVLCFADEAEGTRIEGFFDAMGQSLRAWYRDNM